MRVISLVPSSTETLLALGADVVACTRFCEQPHLRHVGGTKNPDVDAIVRLAPDLVVLDREENRREDADALRAHGLRLFVSEVTTVESAVAVVGELAASVGLDAPTAPTIRSASGPPIGVFVPIWRRPWMSIGSATYGADLLRHIGCRSVAADLGNDDAPNDAYPTVDLADVAALGPAAVLVPSEPYVFADDHLGELRSAMPGASIVRVDGQDLFWWGIRTHAAVAAIRSHLVTAGVLPPTG